MSPYNEYKKAWKIKRYNQGLCFRCGQPRLSDSWTCQPCLDKASSRTNTWREKMIAEQHCTSCGEPSDSPKYRHCSSCRAKKRKAVLAKQHEAKNQGICTSCFKNPITPPSSIYCTHCYTRHIKSNRKQHSKDKFGGNWELILNRDNHSCQACETTKRDNRLEVHHRDGNRKNNDPDNLITLCHSCHVTLTRAINSSGLQVIIQLVKEQRPDV